MKKKFSGVILAVVLVVAMLFATACGGNQGDSKEISLKVGTGSTTGTYFAFTNVVGTALKSKTGYNVDVLSTGGSVANINGLADGDYNMAIVQNDTMINAYNGLDKDNFAAAIKDFSVVGEVYSEVIQIVVRGDLNNTVKSVENLKGLRVSVGDVGSGVYNNAKVLLNMCGLDMEKDIEQSNLSVNKSADAMKDGQLDAFFFTAGVPTTAITELATSMDVFMLSLSDEVIDKFIDQNKIDGKYEVYSKQAITNEHYTFIAKDAPAYTIRVTATFIVSNNLSEEAVYNITKALWESKADIAAGHAVGASMDVKNAAITLGNVPLHAGAEKYYKEVGVI